MKKMSKKCLALLLSLLMLVSVAPLSFAAVSPSYADGVLTISGEGAMGNYGTNTSGNNANTAPWYNRRNTTTSIVIEEGVTSIGRNAFYGFTSAVRSISLPKSLTSISGSAFPSASLENATITYAGTQEDWENVDVPNNSPLNGKVTFHTHTANAVESWDWAEDRLSADAVLVCTDCEETFRVEAVVTKDEAESEAPTCVAAGKDVMKAKITSPVLDIDMKTITLDPTGHEIDPEQKEADPATCTDDGTVAYYECTVCHKTFADAEGTEEITDIVDPATGHTYGIPAWTWTGNDADGYTAATATFVCAENDDTQTVDATVESVTTPETCVANGNITYTATVTFNEVEYTDDKVVIIDELEDKENHTASDTVNKYNSEGGPFVDCTAEGNYSMQVCAVCGVEFGKAEIAKRVNHADALITTVAATCTEDGLSAHQECTICGKLLSTATVLPKTGHSFTAVAEKDPTCAEEGHYAYWTCSVCNKYFRSDENRYSNVGEIVATEEESIADQLKIDKVPHDGRVLIQSREPSCLNKGTQTVYRCKNCPANYILEDGKQIVLADVSEAEIEPLGHNWLKDDFEGSVGYKAPTCAEEGYCNAKCSRCDAAESITLEKTPHNGDWVRWEPATCTRGSYDVFLCKDCGNYYEEDTGDDSLGHDFPRDVFTVIQEASCTHEGIEARQCMREGCDAYAEEDARITPKLDHVLKDDIQEAKCLEAGYAKQYCENCHQVFKDETLDALGHVDADNNVYCDRCNTVLCDHLCHKTDIFSRLIWFIANVWYQFLGINKECKCGLPHYSGVVIPTVD